MTLLPKILLSLSIIFMGGMVGKAHAMHIAEGILPLSWAAIWFAVAVPFMVYGLYDLKQRSKNNLYFKPITGLVGAAVFIISCMPIPVPFAGTTSHPCGVGMAAIILGPGPTVVLSGIILLLQALFMAHGGLSSLGADVVSMGIAGAFAGYGIFKLSLRMGAGIMVAAFLAGLFSDWITYGVTAFQLASALHGDGSMWHMFVAVIVAFVPTQVPLGLIEGILTAGAYKFIMDRRPELLQKIVPGAAI